jgi:hypothetical protein
MCFKDKIEIILLVGFLTPIVQYRFQTEHPYEP